MVLKLYSVSEPCSQRAFILTPTNQAPCSTELCPVTLEFLLLQEGVELPLNIVEGVFTHVVHLACFPALLPLF